MTVSTHDRETLKDRVKELHSGIHKLRAFQLKEQKRQRKAVAEAIEEAVERGVPATEIGEYLGISTVRVHQLRQVD